MSTVDRLAMSMAACAVVLAAGSAADACDQDDDCKTGRVCINGVCTALAPPPPTAPSASRSCERDGDCSIADVCQARRCVPFAQRKSPSPAPEGPSAPVPSAPRASPPEPGPSAPPGAGLMAVLELENKVRGAEHETIDRSYFSDRIRRAALKALPQLRLMTRENMEVIARSMGVQMEQCDEDQCVDTGRKLGADTVVNGSLLKVGTRFKLVLRMHETKTGRLLSIVEASGKDVDELDANTEQAMGELFAPLVGEVPPPRPVQAAAPPPFSPSPFSPSQVPAPVFVGESTCRAGTFLLAGACKPLQLQRKAMRLCRTGSTFAFCNDEEGELTENDFISRYRVVTGQSNLDRHLAPRRSTTGASVITAFGITGIVASWVAFKCTAADISNNNCPGQSTSGLNTPGFALFMGSVVATAAGIGWAAYAIVHANGTPDDHSIGEDQARASVDEYNRKLQ